MKLFNKTDIIIYATVISMLIASFLVWGRAQGDAGDYVVVSVNGNEMIRLPLSTDTEKTIEGFAGLSCTICIKDGEASVTEADCPDNLCAEHNPISMSGESIVCLPARITLTIQGTENSGVDGVAR